VRVVLDGRAAGLTPYVGARLVLPDKLYAVAVRLFGFTLMSA
jgi:hypothetical protein